jgi:3-phosphoshikimate 1-carboxyvinyltransferase
MSIVIPCVEKPIQARVKIPGSKSVTNRAILLASLADGDSLLQNVLFSDDTETFIHALSQLGVEIAADRDQLTVNIVGCSGRFPRAKAAIDCRDAGTVARFLLAACANQVGEYRFDGSLRLRQRPLHHLVEVLRKQGAALSARALPLIIHNTDRLQGGGIFIPSNISSQFLSGLLMIAPYFQIDTMLETKKIVSEPYIEMTCAMMHDFGVDVFRHEKTWRIKSGQKYQAKNYLIESDFSSASYFAAAAAVTTGEVVLLNMSPEKSIQGDKRFLDVLQQMGCLIQASAQCLTVVGPQQLKGVTVDMQDFSDTMMTLAAIAPFADSPTHIVNIANTRVKECDRIAAMVYNLRELGIRVDEEKTALTIYPGIPRAGIVNTYQDHRIAMACSLIGLKVPGIVIDDVGCVSKTFPDFFNMFIGMC